VKLKLASSKKISLEASATALSPGKNASVLADVDRVKSVIMKSVGPSKSKVSRASSSDVAFDVPAAVPRSFPAVPETHAPRAKLGFSGSGIADQDAEDWPAPVLLAIKVPVGKV
jgi:hypothetical protein